MSGWWWIAAALLAGIFIGMVIERFLADDEDDLA